MVPNATNNNADNEGTRENLAYIRQMLAELRQVASRGGHRIAHVLQLDTRQCGDVRGVDAANATGTENSNVLHKFSRKKGRDRDLNRT